MARPEVLPQFQAPAWIPARSEFLVLWHGTITPAREGIERRIDLTKCAVDTDFGRGFYLTTLERQARLWAWKQYTKWRERTPTGEGNPLVMRFRVRRFSIHPEPRRPAEVGLDSLRSLDFTRGGFDNDDYWSFVQHCRSSVPTDAALKRRGMVRDHKRGPKGRGWYDVVSGPVAAFWEQRSAMHDSDQYSFHTPVGVTILQDLIALAGEADPTTPGSDSPYSWFPVT